MRRHALVLVGLVACGRLEFTALDDASTRTDTGDTPAPLADCANHQTALFCDGFEDPALGAWTTRGMIARVTAPVMRGGAALRAQTQMTQQVSEAKVESFGAISSGPFHARGWFYVPSSITVIHFDLLDAVVPAMGGIAVLGYMNNLDMYQNTSGEGTADGPPLPRDRWLCIELAMQVGDVGKAEVLLDGVVVSSFASLDTLPGAGYTRIAVGLAWTDDGQGPAEVFVDEIVIDTKPIGCD